eukprot:810253-Pleurochrysis_carterae.AAC.1
MVCEPTIRLRMQPRALSSRARLATAGVPFDARRAAHGSPSNASHIAAASTRRAAMRRLVVPSDPSAQLSH